MKILDYIRDKGIKQRQAAEEIGITEGYLSNLICGRQLPSAKLAFRIHRWSDGNVTINDFFEEAA